MPGDLILIEGGPDGRIEQYLRALAQIPAEPRWVLVGGLAVNARLAVIHRVTNDVDTVSSDQIRTLEILAETAGAEKLGHAKVRVADVEVDVMASTEGDPLPDTTEERAFALARRWAMATATSATLGVLTAEGSATFECELKIATPAALVAMKTVSAPRRTRSNHREKLGSDIHDLYRLVEGHSPDRVLHELAGAHPDLIRWVGETLQRMFIKDLRLNNAIFHRLDRTPDADAITEAALSVLGDLGAALIHP